MSGGNVPEYAVFGNKLPDLEEGAYAVKQAGKYDDGRVRDEQGRIRFHGAFTGGFSAGYFNTVGTKEGWAPSTFISSRGSRAGVSLQSVEDFLDDEDKDDAGIAPKRLKTDTNFQTDTERSLSSRNKFDEFETNFSNIFRPTTVTAGVELLMKYGYRVGKGVGVRNKQKSARRKNIQKKTYGCALPPELGGGGLANDDSDDDMKPDEFSFLMDDIPPIQYSLKADTRGMGYEGLDFGASRTTENTSHALFSGSNRKGIKGHAFGVGALDEDDDYHGDNDVYGQLSMDNYSFEEVGKHDDEDRKRQVAEAKAILAKKQHIERSVVLPAFFPIGGFHQSSAKATTSNKRKHRRPLIPRDFNPKRAAAPSVTNIGAVRPARNAIERSVILNERDKLPAPKRETTAPVASTDDSKMAKGGDVISSKKYSFDERYEIYKSLRKEGKSYADLPDMGMTAWEKEQENEKMSRRFRIVDEGLASLGGDWASKFRRGSSDDATQSVRSKNVIESDIDKAVRLKQFGLLTRKTITWEPVDLVCIRFNVKNPNVVSGSNTDKTKVSGEQDASKKSTDDDKESAVNIFEFLENEPLPSAAISREAELLQEVIEEDISVVPIEEREKPSMDLFASIFGNDDMEEIFDEADLRETEALKRPQQQPIHLSAVTSERRRVPSPDLIFVKVDSQIVPPQAASPIRDRSASGSPQPFNIFSVLDEEPEQEENVESYGPALPPSFSRVNHESNSDVEITHVTKKSKKHKKKKHKHEKNRKILFITGAVSEEGASPMADKRKLHAEIDRCLKKVDEGFQTFDELWTKVVEAPNQNQKEKNELLLKKEIKKLQRDRDQIKVWQASSEVRGKDELLSARSGIEERMEKFKQIERETKTKAFSKEGLLNATKIDPQEKAKLDTQEWIREQITALAVQQEQFEADLETLNSKKKKFTNDEQARVDKLTYLMQKHTYNTEKLEACLRAVDNEILTADDLQQVKEDVEYYVDNNDDLYDDRETQEFALDPLSVLKLEEAALPPSIVQQTSTSPAPTDNTEDDKENSTASSSPSPAPITQKDRTKSASRQNSTQNSTSRQSSTNVTPLKPDSLSVSSSSMSSGKPTGQQASRRTMSATSPFLGHSATGGQTFVNALSSGSSAVNTTSASRWGSSNGNAPVGVALQSNSIYNNPPSAAAYEIHQPIFDLQTKETPSMSSIFKTTSVPGQQPPPSLASATSPMLQQLSMSARSASSNVMPSTLNQSLAQHQSLHSSLPQSHVVTNASTPVAGAAERFKSPSSSFFAFNSDPSAISVGGPVSTSAGGSISAALSNSGSMNVNASSIYNVNVSQSMPMPKLSSAHSQNALPPGEMHITPAQGLAPLGKMGYSKLHMSQKKLLEYAVLHIPAPQDTEKVRPHLPRTLCPTPPFYPQTVPDKCNIWSLDFWKKLDPEVLFFAFYYLEGTKAQLLAAQALKEHSWRFHTQYNTWFQRAEQPEQVNKQSEIGSYLYFDFTTWKQMKRDQFEFQYKYLEDRNLAAQSNS